MYTAIKRYIKTLLNAIRGKETITEITRTEIKDIGFSQADLSELNRIYPYKLYKKGCTLEELAVGSGEQRVINSITNMVKRRSSDLTIR